MPERIKIINHALDGRRHTATVTIRWEGGTKPQVAILEGHSTLEFNGSAEGLSDGQVIKLEVAVPGLNAVLTCKEDPRKTGNPLTTAYRLGAEVEETYEIALAWLPPPERDYGPLRQVEFCTRHNTMTVELRWSGTGERIIRLWSHMRTYVDEQSGIPAGAVVHVRLEHQRYPDGQKIREEYLRFTYQPDSWGRRTFEAE